MNQFKKITEDMKAIRLAAWDKFLKEASEAIRQNVTDSELINLINKYLENYNSACSHGVGIHAAGRVYIKPPIPAGLLGGLSCPAGN